MKSSIRCIIIAVLWMSPAAWAGNYQSTGFTTLYISADNGVTYFYPTGYTTLGTCQYNRLELRETGDYYGDVENGRRMYAMILVAQLTGKLIELGYNDGDGPACRVASVQVQW